MALELWLPPSAQEPKPKTYRCLCCGREWPEGQKTQWGRHVARCAERNNAGEQEVEDMESSVYTSIADKEHFRWLRSRGATRPLRRRRSKR